MLYVDYDCEDFPNEKNKCLYVFNPTQPLDSGVQADCDNNDIGDVTR
jgi:hypothetical protein